MENKDYPLYEVEKITNLRQLVELRAGHSEREAAFAYEEDGKVRQVTYREFKEQTEWLGTWFFSQGFHGEKIALLGENSYEWLLVFFAAVGGNQVVVPLDREAPVEDLCYILGQSGTSVLVCSEQYRDVAERLAGNMPLRLIGMGELPGLLEEGRALGAQDRSYLNHRVDEHAMAAIFYTSGTTGESKGVMLTNRGFAVDAYSACRNAEFDGDTLLLLPLHHTFGIVAGVLVTMVYGYTVYLNRSLRYLQEDLKKAKPKNLFLVPLFVETLYKNLWDGIEKSGKADAVRAMIGTSRRNGDDAPTRREKFSFLLDAFGGRLEYIISGGAPLRPEYIQGFADFGITVLNGYGITECSPVVSVNRNHLQKESSVGRVLPDCRVRIEEPDENGEGEICVKGDIVMPGYYNKEAETAEALADGWFHTGDIGRVDEDNYLYITGRKKNLIICSNGENVSPEELEAQIQAIGCVSEVVVYAAGEKIVAEIYSAAAGAERETAANGPELEVAANSGGSGAEQTIRAGIAELNRTLPAFKRISEIRFRDTEFEKTTTKKIKRTTRTADGQGGQG